MNQSGASMTGLALRLLDADELDWANTYYASVGLQPSSEDTFVYALERDSESIGLARIVPLDSQCGELSALHLFKQHRGEGLAPIFMKMILEKCPYRWLYSIAYVEHSHLYMDVGFELVTNYFETPKPIMTKYQWCLDNLPHPVQMLELRRL